MIKWLGGLCSYKHLWMDGVKWNILKHFMGTIGTPMDGCINQSINQPINQSIK